MGKVLTDKEYSRMTSELDKVKVRCRCGAKIILPMQVEKGICRRCKHWVFRDKKKEFKYRLQEKIRKEK